MRLLSQLGGNWKGGKFGTVTVISKVLLTFSGQGRDILETLPGLRLFPKTIFQSLMSVPLPQTHRTSFVLMHLDYKGYTVFVPLTIKDHRNVETHIQ